MYKIYKVDAYALHPIESCVGINPSFWARYATPKKNGENRKHVIPTTRREQFTKGRVWPL